MVRKILTQTLICLLLVFGLHIAKNSGIDVIQAGTEKVIEYMSVNYTPDDIRRTVGKTVEVFKPIYGEPIDEEYEGDETPVYAVGAGKVISVGENEEIGKYIKIIHGDRSESLYGNLLYVKVNSPSNVKKGQIIGIYSKSKGEQFYYSFKK